jgi:hypothetical protein
MPGQKSVKLPGLNQNEVRKFGVDSVHLSVTFVSIVNDDKIED